MRVWNPIEALITLLPAVALLLGMLAIYASGTWAASEWHLLAPIMGFATIALLVMPIAVAAVRPGSDAILIGVSGMLLSIGMVTLIAIARTGSDSAAFYQSMTLRQMTFVGAGCILLVFGVVASRYIEHLTRFPYTLLAAALALTSITMLLGESVNGARLWLNLGPVTFQPAELSRLLLASFIAVYLYDKRYLASTPWNVGQATLPPIPYLLPLLVSVVAAIAVLGVQNDFGMAALIAFGALAAVTLAVRSRVLTAAGLLFLVVAGVVLFIFAARVRSRFGVWLDPWSDPGATGFQFVRSEYTLSAASIIGMPRTAGELSVPEIHTDFVIAAIGGQFGWLVALAVIVLAGILVCRCVIAALHAGTTFQSLLALVFASLIGTQIILILGGTLRMLPLTGLTLPMVSYGGTSMLSTLFAIGVTIGIGARGRERDRQWST